MSTQFAPETADGWAVLHQFFHVDWQVLYAMPRKEKNDLVETFTSYLAEYARPASGGQSAAFHILGHKGQLMLLHFRPTFKDCAQTELELSTLGLAKYLKLADSYVSVVELGMYHTTKKVIEALEEKGVKPYSEEWTQEYQEKLAPHKENLKDRCFTEIPEAKYYCFYPMDKKRGEQNNWYAEPIDKRAVYMMEHGMTGRRFAGKVKQIISGSIGFDDWEWGVDLFADNPLDIKRLIYEMRFDDATSLYGAFGKFYFGTALPYKELQNYFSGKIA